jgi:hypothetical protein
VDKCILPRPFLPIVLTSKNQTNSTLIKYIKNLLFFIHKLVSLDRALNFHNNLFGDTIFVNIL